MLNSLPTFARLEAELSKLPGIGSKTAARLAFHLLRTSEQDVEALAAALLEMRRKVRFRRRCFHIAEEELCQICSNPVRESQSLCVVQEPQDLLAIERSHSYSGLYHVLHVWSRNQLKKLSWPPILPLRVRPQLCIWVDFVKKKGSRSLGWHMVSLLEVISSMLMREPYSRPSLAVGSFNLSKPQFIHRLIKT